MRISDWSSDVCSSDLAIAARRIGVETLDVGQQEEKIAGRVAGVEPRHRQRALAVGEAGRRRRLVRDGWEIQTRIVRKSVVEGKSVSGRVDLGGRRVIKNKAYMES